MALWNFEVIPDYFVNYLELERQSPGHKVATQPDFGLAFSQSRHTKPWHLFVDHVAQLNREGGEARAYKIIFLSRHGLGYHNVQEAKVGTEAWDNHWSLLDGDGTVTWVDAHLVPEGIAQAEKLGQIWLNSVERSSVPVPQTLYCSPLARCLETCRLSLLPLYASRKLLFKPKVRELLRERLWDHTCDKRSPRSWIEQNYPEFDIEDGMTEEDLLWKPRETESLQQHAERKRKVLEEIFEADDSQVISLTIHSGAIAAFCMACGADAFHVAEGGCVALLVKGTRLGFPN